VGTVGSPEKVARALENGYAEVIDTSREPLVDRLRDITGGDRQLPVVYDGVGASTFLQSLDLLRPRGLLVSFGNASGPPPHLDLQLLSTKGSLYVTRPTLASYTASSAELRASAAAVLGKVMDGSLRVTVNHRYPLAQAALAHRDLQARRTTSSVLLVPPDQD
jgi:NADPH2:quinone reductase